MTKGMLPHLVEELAEETAILYLTRLLAVVSPDVDLEDLSGLDERLEAQIDGLRLAGEAGWTVAEEAMLGWEEEGEVFCAALLAFEGSEKDRIEKVLACAHGEPELVEAVIAALVWLPATCVASRIAPLLAADDAVLRRIGLAAAAAHRLELGKALTPAIEDGDAALRAQGLRIAGERGLVAYLPLLRAHFEDAEPSCRLAAVRSAVLLGDSDAAYGARPLAASGAVDPREAALVAIAGSDRGAITAWLAGLDRPRLALIAAGLHGDPVAVPGLLQAMAEPELSRLAGEALTAITGVDLEEPPLEGEPPEGFEAGPDENPENEDVALDPDEDLPWPEPDAVTDWWAAHGDDYPVGKRLIAGLPRNEDGCSRVLEIGTQRLRALAAFLLAAKVPEQALFDVTLPAARQIAWLQGSRHPKTRAKRVPGRVDVSNHTILGG